jgi:hypothetical protein
MASARSFWHRSCNFQRGGSAMEFQGNRHQDSYAVEVSGWDVDECFFVEKTDLTWTADGMKEISLRQRVREGSVIFVRLMQPAAQNDNCPIACQAVKVGEPAANGRAAIQLTQLRPRAFFRDTVRELVYSSSQVA